MRNVEESKRLAATGRGARFLQLGRLLPAGCLVLFLACLPVLAGEADDEKGKPAEPVEMKPTEVGIRFTPKMARGVSKQFVKQMKDRYDLDDDQVDAIRQILSTQFMQFASENAEAGRNLMEAMIESVIENDGEFPKESAQQFARLARPMVGALKGFFTETSGKISRRLTVKQRLSFTGDVAAATAGLLVFENRMKRWEEGNVGDNANPFWDPADEDPSKAESEPGDPNESPEHRRTRKHVERVVERQINIDEKWEDYLNRAITYYELSEPQKTSAKAILTDCKERIRRIKTPELRAALVQNLLAQRLGWRLSEDIRRGPWMYALDVDYEKLRKPLTDLEEEFKRRLDDLPTSEQRAAAEQRVQKLLAEKGVKKQS